MRTDGGATRRHSRYDPEEPLPAPSRSCTAMPWATTPSGSGAAEGHDCTASIVAGAPPATGVQLLFTPPGSASHARTTYGAATAAGGVPAAPKRTSESTARTEVLRRMAPVIDPK